MKQFILLMGICLVVASCSSNSGSSSSADSAAAKSPAAVPAGLALMSTSDCMTCHKVDVKIVGPAFKDIAAKYTANDATISTLTDKVIKGGKGNWGDVAMTPHPALKEADVKEMVKYVLSLK